MRTLFSGAVCLLAVLLAGSAASARQMPDPRQMSGVPLPVSELPTGTVTVRVIRGSLANAVPSQTVEITGAGGTQKAVTNEAGRAEFKGLPAGSRVRAVATVGSERLESQEFSIPPKGGIRLMLVAAEPAASDAAAPSPPHAIDPGQPGTLVFGEESRFVFEPGEDGLSAFYILPIENPSTSPVQPTSPVTFELPGDARNGAILNGSSPQASVNGREVTVAGPFAPGRTLVQVAYTIPYGDSNLDIEQTLPLTLRHLAVVAQKIGEMRLHSPQIAEQRDMPAQGHVYIAGRGGAVEAGQALQFNFSGMPHSPNWPRTLALVLAVLVLAGGAWSSWRAGAAKAPEDVRRQELEESRERLFEELAQLEATHRDQTIDPERYVERRRELIAALERVYSALDDAAAVQRAS